MAKYQVKPGNHIRHGSDKGIVEAHGAPVTHPPAFNGNAMHAEALPIVGERPKDGSDVIELSDAEAKAILASNPGCLIPLDGVSAEKAPKDKAPKDK